ncbi:MAG: rhodanese-like domain-containing protein [Nostocoides sp.]
MTNRIIRSIGLPLAVTALLGLGLSGCSGSSTTGTTQRSVPATAPASGAHLAPAEFAAALTLPNTTVLDVRTPEEFAAGHLTGAVNVNLEGDFAGAIAAYTKDKPYAIYCRSGNRSGQALSIMAEQGFTQAYDLAGGISAWQTDGGEVVTGP